MKQIIFCLMAGMFSGYCCAQTETFDNATFTPPKNFTKNSRKDAVVYSQSNSNGGFCLVAIYASTVSTGDEKKDFAVKWKDLVVTLYKGKAGPKTEITTSAEGWKAVVASTPITQDGVDSYIILTVFSGFGKTSAVLVNLNDQSYFPQVDSVLQSLKFGKTSTTSPVNNSAGKFGHLLLPSVKGWKLQLFSNAAIFSPPDLETGQFFELRVLESKPFNGTMQQALATSWNDALLQLDANKAYDGDPYIIETEKKSYKGWDYIRGRGVFKAIGNENNRYDMRLFVIKVNNRIERIAAWGLMNVGNGNFSPWSNPRYEDAINEFVYSIKFDDWKDPLFANGVIVNNGISGLYEGLKLSGGGLDGNYTVFYPNGQVFNGPKFPLSGLYGLNTWVEAELRTRYWGTYSITNGQGMIKMIYGNIPLKIKGSGIVLTTQNTEHTYTKLPGIDGAVFNGTYGFNDMTGVNAPSLTFTNDGKFNDKGVLDILNHQTTDPFDIAKKPGGGTYEVKEFTILFHYSDGRNLQLVFMGEGYNKKDSSPGSLEFSFNHDMIYRR